MVIRSRRGCAPRADSVLLACNELQPTRRRLRRIHHSSDRKSRIGEQQVTDRAHQKPPHAQACGGSKARSSRAATPRRTRPARRRGRGAGCGNPAWRHRRRCDPISTEFSNGDHEGARAKSSNALSTFGTSAARLIRLPSDSSRADGPSRPGSQSRAIASAGVTYVHRPPATRKEWPAPIGRRLDSAVSTSAPAIWVGVEPGSRRGVEASARTITTHSFPGRSCRRRGLGRGEDFGGTP
jgi:hypothetical protein